ncbi:MAG: 16S rRNA (cytidine(1402)-2'-O)-methyltransferase [Peptococcaceae bacterium]|nr:16S rRNA (cytidine(1402)-2'-O)-methyltransferase [Peptococcaceae bacterium]
MNEIEPGTLYVCATPIGNMADITLRVLDVLRGVDLVAAEDTRHSRKLLSRYEIKTPVVSYHEHNEKSKTVDLLERLARGESVALVSDAGMPGISDPGGVLITACRERGIAVDVLPGPNAVVTALVASGLATGDTYFFGGFLPVGKKRRQALADLEGLLCTVVLYEAPHRLVQTLWDLLEVLGERNCAVCRELTKIHQQIHRGTFTELLREFEGVAPRGECCLVIGQPVVKSNSKKPFEQAGFEVTDLEMADMRSMWGALTGAGMEGKEAVKEVARRLGVPKREVYQVVMIKEVEDV